MYGTGNTIDSPLADPCGYLDLRAALNNYTASIHPVAGPNRDGLALAGDQRKIDQCFARADLAIQAERVPGLRQNMHAWCCLVCRYLPARSEERRVVKE